eukprot:364564-Chlamydomonas_euryale.AAC.6
MTPIHRAVAEQHWHVPTTGDYPAGRSRNAANLTTQKTRPPKKSSKKRGSQAEKWGCTACRGANQRAEPNIQGKGEACGVGRRTLAARSLGAPCMCTMLGRGAAQSSRLRSWGSGRVGQGPSGGRIQGRELADRRRAGQPLSLGPHGHSQPSIYYAHERMRRPLD